ncbi:hypothetical protein BDV12DRAFT_184669 [Aspergillus spectabilis]
MPGAETPTTYGFIGLELMGLPMCKNIASKITPTERIRIFDLNHVAMDQLYKEFPSKSQIIITMLPEGRHVESVYISGPNALSTVSRDGTLLIDCSTIDTATSLAIKDHLSAHFPRASFYDAAVSGGVIGAQIIPCGGPSLGLTAKLCNNYLSGILIIANSETFKIGMRAGLSPKKLYRVLGAGSAQNTICDNPSSHGYTGGFRMALMLKDFTLATQMAERVLGGKGLEMYSLLSGEAEYKDLDVRAMFKFIGGLEDWEQHGEGKGH